MGHNCREKIILEIDALRLVDFLSEDDFLLPRISGDSFEGFRLSVALENRNEHHHGRNQEWQNTTILQKLERNSSKNSEAHRGGVSRIIGSRKSLAWDNAFFTSPGILDYEELSTLSNGLKDGSHFLALEQLQKSSSPKSKIDEIGCDIFSFKCPLDDISEDACFPIQYESIHGVKSSRSDVRGAPRAFPNQGRRNAVPERNKKMLPLHNLRVSQQQSSEITAAATRRIKTSTRRSLFGGEKSSQAARHIPPLPKTNKKHPPKTPKTSPSQLQQSSRPRTGSPLERVGGAIPKLLMLGRRKV